MEAVKLPNSEPPVGIIIHRSVTRYRNNSSASGQDSEKPNMPDDYTNQQTKKQALEQIPDRKLEKGATLLGLISAASLRDGALAKMVTNTEKGAKFFDLKIADKAGVSLHTAKNWGVAVLGVVAGFKLIDAATEKIPGLKNFREDHPVTTGVGILAGGIGAGLAANPLINAASDQIAKISVDSKTIGTRFSEKASQIAKRLNASKFGQNLDKYLYKPTEKFLTETKVGRFTATFGIPAAIVAVIARAAVNADNDYSTVKKIKKQLSEQEAANQNPFVAEGNNSHIRIVKSNKIYIFQAEEESKA